MAELKRKSPVLTAEQSDEMAGSAEAAATTAPQLLQVPPTPAAPVASITRPAMNEAQLATAQTASDGAALSNGGTDQPSVSINNAYRGSGMTPPRLPSMPDVKGMMDARAAESQASMWQAANAGRPAAPVQQEGILRPITDERPAAPAPIAPTITAAPVVAPVAAPAQSVQGTVGGEAQTAIRQPVKPNLPGTPGGAFGVRATPDAEIARVAALGEKEKQSALARGVGVADTDTSAPTQSAGNIPEFKTPAQQYEAKLATRDAKRAELAKIAVTTPAESYKQSGLEAKDIKKASMRNAELGLPPPSVPVQPDKNDPAFKAKMAQAGYENQLVNEAMSKKQAWDNSSLGKLGNSFGALASAQIGMAYKNRARNEEVKNSELAIKANDSNIKAASHNREAAADAEKIGVDHLKKAAASIFDAKKGPEYNQAIESGATAFLAAAKKTPGQATPQEREQSIHHSSIAQKLHEVNKGNWGDKQSKGPSRDINFIAPHAKKTDMTGHTIYVTKAGEISERDLSSEEVAQMEQMHKAAWDAEKKSKKPSLQDGKK